MLQKLDPIEAEFKTHHYALVDLIDGDNELQEKQERLDPPDDEMSTLVVQIQQPIIICNSLSHSAAHKIASQKFILLQSEETTFFSNIKNRLVRENLETSATVPFLDPEDQVSCKLCYKPSFVQPSP